MDWHGVYIKVYHPIVCRETTADKCDTTQTQRVYHPIVCRETTA